MKTFFAPRLPPFFESPLHRNLLRMLVANSAPRMLVVNSALRMLDSSPQQTQEIHLGKQAQASGNTAQKKQRCLRVLDNRLRREAFGPLLGSLWARKHRIYSKVHYKLSICCDWWFIARYSPDFRHFFRVVMMKESKLTNFQQRQLSDRLKG